MKCDIVIVGAGTAGAVLASRLAEAGAQVVLVEAGPDYPDPESLPPEIKYGYATAAYAETHGHLWDYTAIAADGQAATPLPRGKVVGGTGAVNGQVFLRALRDDFRLWVAAGNDAWNFQQVLPFYKSLESDHDFDDEWHGRDGPVAVRRYRRDEWLETTTGFYEACRAAGYEDCPDANRPEARGVGPIPFNNVGGLRLSSAVTHLAAARARTNLTILSNAFARRLRLAGGRASGVEVETGSEVKVLEADEYILSAGAIGSPTLLMHSGIGPEQVLKAAGLDVRVRHEGVGQRLSDHQLVDLVFEAGVSLEDSPANAPRVQVALRYTAAESEPSDDMQITMRTSAPGPQPTSVVSLAPSLQLPESCGQVVVDTADPTARPRIELNFLASDVDRVRLMEGIELCFALARDERLSQSLGQRVAPAPVDSASRQALASWLRSAVRTSHHCCGTCAMGPATELSAVVDQSGRVWGVPNLRVVDASIFPVGVRANPNATILMLAERIAATIASGREVALCEPSQS